MNRIAIAILSDTHLPAADLLAVSEPSPPLVEKGSCFPQISLDEQLDSRATPFASVKGELDVPGGMEATPRPSVSR